MSEPFDSKYKLFTQIGVPFSGMNYDKLEQHDPMPLVEVLEKVREGCQMQMYWLDEQGYCSESDDYVVALAFFEDYIEKIKAEEEEEAMSEGELAREGTWAEFHEIMREKPDADPYDHIEEIERDHMLGQDEEENA